MQIDLTLFGTIIVAMGIPSGITSFYIWRIQRNIERREKKRDERDDARRKNELLLIRGVGASIALGEATVRAIKNDEINGDLDKALEYAQKVKHEQKEFLNEQGVANFL